MCGGLTERQHLFFLHQPGAHFALEYGLSARRAEPLAVNNTQAAQVSLVAVLDKRGKRFAGLVCAQAMEVKFRAQRPMSLAQFSQRVCRNAISGEGQTLIAIEQRIGCEIGQPAEF